MPRKGSSIRVRKSGRYEARYRDPEGKMRGKVFGTEAEAKAFLIDTRKQVQDKTWSDPDLGRMSFAQVSAQWLAHERERQSARPTTIDGYERTLRVYAEPVFGSRQIASITSAQLETWVAGLTKNGKPVAARTKRSAFFPVQATLSYAARHRIIRYNPCADVRLPEGKATVKGHFLTREEVAAIAAEAEKITARTTPKNNVPEYEDEAADYRVYGLMIRFAAGTGLRASEMAGLRVRDLLVDEDKNQRLVNVERTVKKKHPADWVVDEPKTERSTRKVPILDDDLLNELRAYLADHPCKEDPDAPLWPGRNQRGRLVYGTSENPHYWNQSAFYRAVFVPAVAAAGIETGKDERVRWHDLRHTCVSQWLEDGHLMYEVSRWAGHSSLAFTDRVYAHLAENPDYTMAVARTMAAKAAQKAPVLALPTAEAG